MQPAYKRLVTEESLTPLMAQAITDALAEYVPPSPPPAPRVIKPEATTRTVASRSPDPHLQLSVEAGVTYRLECDLYYTADIAADLSITWASPAESTMFWTPDCFPTEATGGANAINRTFRHLPTLIVTLGGTGAPVAALIRGTFTAGADGLLRLMWAKATAHASDATVHAGSLLRLERL